MTEKKNQIAEMGSKGGKARAASLTPEERSEQARKAVTARWDKAEKAPKATHDGPLQIGDILFDCAVLEDGTRVISELAFTRAMGLYRSGTQYTRRDDDSAQIPSFLTNKNLKPFVDKHLSGAHNSLIRYRMKRGTLANGIRAELIPKICEVWLDARKAGGLGPTQEMIAEKAELLIRAFAHVGIIALVDEATGYQYDRQKTELQEFLAEFLSEELRRWVKTFPNQYFKELCRLRNVTYRPDMRLPPYFGKITNDIVYQRLAPNVLEELQARTERDGVTGRRKTKYHQWLSEDLGHPKLIQHLGLVVGLMKVSDTWDRFVEFMDKAAPSWKKHPLFAQAVSTASATD